MKELKLKKLPAPILEPKEGECKFPVSYLYNGGIVIENEWYDGFEVAPPIIPIGYILVNIGVGLQLNSVPPIATYYLKKIL